MKIIGNISLIFLLLFIGCKTQYPVINTPDEGGVAAIDEDVRIYLNGPYFHEGKYITGVYQRIRAYNYGKSAVIDYWNPRGTSMGVRDGDVLDGKQTGKWLSYKYSYRDSTDRYISKEYIYREENFKNGLHDGFFGLFNHNGDTIYSTYFKNGTGIEKCYYDNGQLYYEIAKKDGYFTDTLKLYNEKGQLAEKLYFIKDSLVYQKIEAGYDKTYDYIVE